MKCIDRNIELRGYRRQIQEIVEAREISRLYHFTPVVNAASILKNGLASSKALWERGIQFHAPDRSRLDDRLGGLSLSIHSINQNLLRKNIRLYGGDWIILELDASLLWTHECRFCWTNAASSAIANYRGFLGGPWALRKMFVDVPVSASDLRSKREIFGRSDNQPTDEQAEVQVFDPIVPALIIDVTVGNARVKREVEALMTRDAEQRPVLINKQVFQF